LRRYLLEEAHEVVDAIDEGEAEALRGELGDLLLNLAFQIVIAEEGARFTREDVVAALEEKMRRRHPHLYGDGEPLAWELSKARERGIQPLPGREDEEQGLLAALEVSADALQDAQRMQARVAEVGFDWPDARGAWEKVREEIDEVGEELTQRGSAALEDEVGDLLFSVVNLARLSGVHAPTAMARANRKFRRRFASLERLARERGIVMEEAGLAALDHLWDEAKREER
jgi:MazG family protein